MGEMLAANEARACDDIALVVGVAVNEAGIAVLNHKECVLCPSKCAHHHVP